MRAVLLAALMVAAIPALAQAPATPAVPAPSTPGTWVPKDTADLLVLDKVNAKSSGLTLKVGQAADNASLSISLRACNVRPPDQPQDSAAYLDIKDSRAGAPGFHGWIFSNEPAVNMLEHPVYDLRLVACR